jgi:hypothetical protein
MIPIVELSWVLIFQACLDCAGTPVEMKTQDACWTAAIIVNEKGGKATCLNTYTGQFVIPARRGNRF